MRQFFSDLWLLIGLRWTLTYNGFRSRKGWQQALQLVGVVMIAGWVIFGAGALGYGLGWLANHYRDLGLEALFPGLILTAVAVVILFSSFAVALGALFLTNDLETLMTAPVSSRAVFTAKILDGLTTYYGIVLISAVPALITYGLGLHYGPLYYLLALVTVLGTPLLPAGFGALLTMLVARFAPARRVREVLGFVGAMIGVGFSILGQSSRLWMRGFFEPDSDPQQILEGVQRLSVIPLPSLIAGRGLADAGTGHWVAAFGNVAGFLLLTFGCFVGSVLLAERLYATGWARMQSAGSASRSKAQVARDAANAGLLGRAPAWLAIALKDWRIIPRDLRNFAQLLTPLFILPVVYFNLLATRNAQGSNQSLDQILRGDQAGSFSSTGIMIAMGILLATALIFRRIASNSISMEGQTWWILKIAPISPGELMRGKLAAAQVPFIILSTILLLIAAIWQRFSVLGTLYGWLGIQLLGMVILATAVGASAPWAKLDWDDPKKMTSGWGSLISMAAGLASAGLAGLLLLLPVLAQNFLPNFTAAAWALGPLLAVGVIGVTVWLSLSLGSQFLRRVGES